MDLMKVGSDWGGAGTFKPFTSGISGAQRTTDAHAKYMDAVLAGRVYSLALNATTTGIAAGQIVAAAAAASTNFAIFNPLASGRYLVLWHFGMGIISGTSPAGPLFYGMIVNGIPTVAATGTIQNNLLGGGAGSVARTYATAAGTTLTGGAAPLVHSCADFSATATAQAVPGTIRAVENLDGRIVLPPGMGWLPLWSGAGTSLLCAYSITWEEIPYMVTN